MANFPQDPTVSGPASLKVLIVDDVQENLLLLEEVLSENGYIPILAKNGMDALNHLETQEIQLIVADAMMPKMDGFQLCKEVRARESSAKIPFVIYTGNYVDGADQEFAQSIGVDRYVVKYAGLGSLVEAINELTEQHYGFKQRPLPAQELINDHEFLEKHHAIIIRKLEEKMAELEMYAEALTLKNRELQASEDRYRGLFDHASIAILVVDKDTGRVLDVNKQGASLLEYAKDDILALPELPFVGGEDLRDALMRASMFSSGEAAMRTKSGQTIDVEVGAAPLERPQDNRILLYVRDITEQKRMREELMQAEKMTLMGRLAASIAHEIRNPLSAVALNLQYLLQKSEADKGMRNIIEDALEGARRVESVVENTLSFARITPPVLKLESINELVEHVLGFLRVPMQEKKITAETQFVSDLPKILVDAKQIEQVILNVLQNAVDASQEGGTVTLATGLMDEPAHGKKLRGPCVVLALRDCGVGISEEQYRHLFEHFRTSKPGGTGLGLAMSKQIMLRHNSDIRIEPALGSGTIVRLVFPAHL
jgi:two-component system, cell cycle sensor histidine kinase and response regulator CckA